MEKGQELVRLRIYAVYAGGVPFVIMTIALIFDNLPDGDFLRPNFGKTKCGFEGKSSAALVSETMIYMPVERNEIWFGKPHTFNAPP